MARKLTAQEHHDEALVLLEESRTKGVGSPARSVILAEAQIHATLALFPQGEEKKPAARRKAAAKPVSEAVPGSEEDLIAKEGAK